MVSPSSVREDRIVQRDEYAAVGSIRRYVIVERNAVGLTVLWRERDEPRRVQALGGSDVLALPEIGVEIPVVSLCARATF